MGAITNFHYKKSIHKGRSYTLEGFGLVDGQMDLISQCIFRQRTFFEVDMLELIRSLVLEPGVWLDIGTNIANHMIYFAAECNATEVLGFEPYHEAFKFATLNIMRNADKLVKTHLFDFGLSDKEETLDLKRTYKSNAGANSVASGDKVIAQVNLKTLDSLELLHNIRFIKIDVESWEINVLAGAIKTIIKNQPIIYTEIRFPSELPPITAFFDAINYEIHWTINEHYLWKPHGVIC